MARVLSIGYLQELLKERNQYIRKGGHQVTPASSVQQSIDLAEHDVFDVLVFGQGVPTADRNFIARYFKNANPEIGVIFLYDGHIDKAELADALLNAYGDPGDLVKTIDDLSPNQSSRRVTFPNSACSAAIAFPSMVEILSRLM